MGLLPAVGVLPVGEGRGRVRGEADGAVVRAVRARRRVQLIPTNPTDRWIVSTSPATTSQPTYSVLSGVSSQRNERPKGRKERKNRKLQPIGTELSSFLLNSSFLRFKN